MGKKLLALLLMGVLVSCNSNEPTNTTTSNQEIEEVETNKNLENLSETNENVNEESKEIVKEEEGEVMADSEIKPFGPVPNDEQMNYYKDELAAFIHFGPNTYTGKEWGDDSYTVDDFKAEKFEADKIVELLKDTGFKKVILTAKHHDGFTLFNSDLTDFDVESSTYDGDILAELSEAAGKHDMDMGLYLSPWDIHEPSYGYGEGGSPEDDKNGDYNDFYVGQIEEINNNPIYGNKGYFTEWWMDGAKGEGEDAQEYDFPRILDAIQAGNPGVLIFGAVADKGGIHWVGNEKGIIDVDTIDPTEASNDKDSQEERGARPIQVDKNGEAYWSVPEADVSITSGWFWGPAKKKPKTEDELANIYFGSVGQGVPLLLNIPPNRDGDVDEDIANALYNFKENIDKSFADNLANSANVTSSEAYGTDYEITNAYDDDYDTYYAAADNKAEIEIDLGEDKVFDCVEIGEYIPLGIRINDFTISTMASDASNYEEYHHGSTIGYKRLIRKNPVTARYIKIEISAKDLPLISKLGVYKLSAGFQMPSDVSNAVKDLEKDRITVDENTNTMTFSFDGAKLYINSNKKAEDLNLKIDIDGKFYSLADSEANKESHKIIFESPVLTNETHEVTITSTENNLDKLNISYLDKNGPGIIEFEKDEYVGNRNTNASTPLEIKVKRYGGNGKAAKIEVATEPGTAVAGQYYEDYTETIEFAEGVEEKTIHITTVEGSTDDRKYFFINLKGPLNAEVGHNSQAKIVLD